MKKKNLLRLALLIVLGAAVALVLGNRERFSAQDLEAAESPTQRQLRVHGLGQTLRALETAGAVTAHFVSAVRNAVVGNAAVAHSDGLAGALGQAGGILMSWGQDTTDSIMQRLESVAVTVEGLAQPPDAVAAATPSAASAPEVPAGEPVPEPSPSADAAPEPAAPGGKAPSLGIDWLASSFERYHDLRAAGDSGAVLGQIFSNGAAAPTGQEEVIAPITEYCYSGAAALRQAMALRETITIGVPKDHQHLLQEIFDLVELGLKETS